MNSMKNLIVQIVKFGFVGGLCFVIDYGLLVILTELFSINYLISAVISFLVSVTVNYLLSVRYVFNTRDNMSHVTEVTVFIALSAVGLVINEIIMWLFTDRLAVHYLISKLIATFIVMVYNFITRKLFLESRG